MISASFGFALLAMLSWGVGDFLIQRATRKIGDIEALAWIGLIGTAGLLPFVYGDLHLLAEPGNFRTLLILGLLTFVMAVFNFEALKRGKLSVVEVILEIELPVTIILGMAFFGERLTGLQWAFIGTIFAGILLIALRPEEFRRHFTLEKGVALAIVAAVGMGVLNFLTAVGAREASPFLAIWVPWVIFTLLCLALIVARGGIGGFLGHTRRFPRLILGMGILDTIAWVFYAFAIRDGELAITTAITESYPAIGVFLGVFLNKERIAVHQAVGALLTIGASVAAGLYS